MLSEEQKFRDKMDGMVSLECKACGKIGQRVRIELAERGELIGLTCRECGASISN